ncbi:MAG TPA: sulfatase [Jatrophihabitantaceae bacterium]|nr:sulfatase [Jatrophihabitantaceae bacterium]
MPVVGARSRGRARAAIAAAIAFATVTAVACTNGTDQVAVAPALGSAPPSPSRPNIVFVLTDDLSTNLLPYMPHVEALAKQGMSFTNFVVSDSLCCPSRASILTGNYPHSTGIFINHGSTGGFFEFQKRAEDKHTFAIPIQARGYRTAFMGKYLNEYYSTYPAPAALGEWTPPQATYVPPGWEQWDGVGNGYQQYNYLLNHDHHVKAHAHRPKDYLNSVLQSYGTSFIGNSAAQHKAFFLEVASFTPHTPNTPAPRDAGTFAGLTAPQDPSFGKAPVDAPGWLANGGARIPFTKTAYKLINNRFRQRVEAVQSVDRMVGALEDRLASTGQLANTVFVFNSDNGYHDGEHGLYPGKMTAFDTDINVPLIVVGPGIAAGSTNNDLVQNIDLAPTFEQLTGATPAPSVEGRSIVPLLHGRQVPWRTLQLVEHEGPDLAPDDPDVQTPQEGNPPTYQAIRSARFTYVHYVDGDTEYYDRLIDPYETDNLAPTLSAERAAQLQSWLTALHECKGAAQCWQAGQPPGV